MIYAVYKHVKAPPTRDVAVYNPSALGRVAPEGGGIINAQHHELRCFKVAGAGITIKIYS